jgi:hypothetical protein
MTEPSWVKLAADDSLIRAVELAQWMTVDGEYTARIET